MSAWIGPSALGPGCATVSSPRPAESLGPWSRVIVLGSRGWTDAAAVRVALTRAWREAGQPLKVVVGPTRTALDAVAEDWVDEHAVAGHQLLRCTSLFFMEATDAEGRPTAWRVLAFVQDASYGAMKCVGWARECGLDVRLREAAS